MLKYWQFFEKLENDHWKYWGQELVVEEHKKELYQEKYAYWIELRFNQFSLLLSTLFLYLLFITILNHSLSSCFPSLFSPEL